jgi:hypothetical protein
MGKKAIPEVLKKPLKSLRFSLLAQDEENERKLRDQQDEINAKLEVLLDFHEIDRGYGQWKQLSYVLAAEKFPGFREGTRGRKLTWSDHVLFILAGAMRRELDAGSNSKAAAAAALVSREPWKSFVNRNPWGAKKSNKPDPAAIILQQYKTMDAKKLTLGEKAMLYHRHLETMGEWDRVVAEYLDGPEIRKQI